MLDKWSKSVVHVYFDVMNSAREFADENGKIWILPRDSFVPVSKQVLWRLLEFDADARTGYIATVQAEVIIEAVMDGGIPPLHECDEEDAWRYRRELHEVAGHIDEYGNRILTSQLWKSMVLTNDNSQFRKNYTRIDDDDLPF